MAFAGAYVYLFIMTAVRTLIVDDDRAIRRVLRAILDGYHDLEIIGEACDGQEAIERTRELEPDLIIMDLSMPILDGLASARAIKEFRPKAEILICSMHETRAFMETSKNLGASGYVVKNEAGSTLLSAVDALLDHRTYFPRLPSV